MCCLLTSSRWQLPTMGKEQARETFKQETNVNTLEDVLTYLWSTILNKNQRTFIWLLIKVQHYKMSCWHNSDISMYMSMEICEIKWEHIINDCKIPESPFYTSTAPVYLLHCIYSVYYNSYVEIKIHESHNIKINLSMVWNCRSIEGLTLLIVHWPDALTICDPISTSIPYVTYHSCLYAW